MTREARLSLNEGSAILEQWLGRSPTITAIRPLHGGMVHEVALLEFDADPGRVVAKVSVESGEAFAMEHASLCLLREQSHLPVPEPYALFRCGHGRQKHVLLLEYVAGVHLGAAPLDAQGTREIEEHMAELLLELHSHTAAMFRGPAGDETSTNWLDLFRPLIEENLKEACARLNKDTRRLAESAVDGMGEFFPSQSPPTLIHGDIWATNVMVRKTMRGWRISGLLDPNAQYADVDCELAYLEVFHTVGDTFFQSYTRQAEIREGYDIRKLYYWLNTLLLHVWLFGDEHYVLRSHKVAQDIVRHLR